VGGRDRGQRGRHRVDRRGGELERLGLVGGDHGGASNDAAIAALSPTDVWVAQLGGLAHYNGTSWTTSSLPSGVNVLTTHAVVSPGHIWFAGYYYPSNAVTAPAVLSTTSG
jgi:hypothetical protein